MIGIKMALVCLAVAGINCLPTDDDIFPASIAVTVSPGVNDSLRMQHARPGGAIVVAHPGDSICYRFMTRGGGRPEIFNFATRTERGWFDWEPHPDWPHRTYWAASGVGKEPGRRTC